MFSQLRVVSRMSRCRSYAVSWWIFVAYDFRRFIRDKDLKVPIAVFNLTEMLVSQIGAYIWSQLGAKLA